MAFVSDGCVFSKSLFIPLPISILEFLAGYACLLSHHNFSVNLMLCSDSLPGSFFLLKKVLLNLHLAILFFRI